MFPPMPSDLISSALRTVRYRRIPGVNNASIFVANAIGLLASTRLVSPGTWPGKGVRPIRSDARSKKLPVRFSTT